MYAIHALEINPPDGEHPVEWMLLSNMPVPSLEEACERVRWYSLHWRIEMFFKVLKSGFRVEACRIGTAERLICYLTLMSIVAWRLFMITLVEAVLRRIMKKYELLKEEIALCYEAGPTGFVLARRLIKLGFNCIVVIWFGRVLKARGAA